MKTSSLKRKDQTFLGFMYTSITSKLTASCCWKSKKKKAFDNFMKLFIKYTVKLV